MEQFKSSERQCYLPDPDEWQQNARSIDPSVEVSEHDASRGLVEEDAGGSADSNTMPSSPFDEVAIRCPEDFLIMYPVMSGLLPRFIVKKLALHLAYTECFGCFLCVLIKSEFVCLKQSFVFNMSSVSM